MKRYISILLCVLWGGCLWGQEGVGKVENMVESQPVPAVAATNDQLWDQANTAYINGAYTQAIALYDTLMGRGQSSYKLYYNLGNACFKAGQTGPSILYYNKALTLSPTDGDVRYNLAIATGYVKDKIDQVPEFFIERWGRELRMSLGCRGWTAASLLMLLLALAGGTAYMLGRAIKLRKAGFWTAAVCAVLFAVTTIFASISRGQMLSPDRGVVMSTAVAVKSSPDRASKDLFVIHEGTTVRVVDSFQQWREVVIADGKKGWIEESSIEMI